MKTRNLIVLVAVVALVAGYIFFYERHQLSTEESIDQADKVFPGLVQSEIRGLTVNNQHGVTRLEKDGDDWRLVEPLAYPADSAAVGSLLTAVADLESERRLAAGEVDPAAYGLDDPEMTVELTADEGRTFVLRVGTTTPLGSNRAVATDADDILLCPSAFAAHLTKEPTAWRSKDVLEAFETDLASLEVVTGDERIHTVRIDGDWQLLEPVNDIADHDYVRRVLADLNSLQIEEFIDHPPGPELGLDDPRYRVTLVRSDGDRPTTLELGAARADDERSLIACRRDGSEVFWVRDTILTPLAKAPVLWRSPKVFPFDTWDAESISVSRDGNTVAASRSDGKWSHADGSEADFPKIQAALRALAELEARSFDLTPPASAELGRVEMSLEGRDDDPSSAVEVLFYTPMSEGGRAMVTVSTRPTIMSVDVGDLDQILVEPGAFAPDLAEPTGEPDPGETD